MPIDPNKVIPFSLNIKAFTILFFLLTAISELAPHMPKIFPEALNTARQITDESKRARALSSYILNIEKRLNFFPQEIWCELIHALGSGTREELLTQISKNTQIIEELGGKESFREIAKSIQDVGKWFP